MRTLIALIFAFGLSTSSWADVTPNELDSGENPFSSAVRILNDLDSQQ